MISGYLIGDKELVRQLKEMPDVVKTKTRDIVQKLGFRLQAHVQATKLTGQVLKVQTGRLRNSITAGALDSRSRFEETGLQMVYYVGTNVSYGAVWEYGGKPMTIVPKSAKALRFMINGSVVFAKRCNVPGRPARPFLAPALQELRPLIITEMEAALKDAMVESLKT